MSGSGRTASVDILKHFLWRPLLSPPELPPLWEPLPNSGKKRITGPWHLAPGPKLMSDRHLNIFNVTWPQGRSLCRGCCPGTRRSRPPGSAGTSQAVAGLAPRTCPSPSSPAQPGNSGLSRWDLSFSWLQVRAILFLHILTRHPRQTLSPKALEDCPVDPLSTEDGKAPPTPTTQPSQRDLPNKRAVGHP